MVRKPIMIGALVLALFAQASDAAEFHVATIGNDGNDGTQQAPLRTIQRAADLAQPGDTITVHEGVYRERVNPPRGGESESRRIVYQAAPGAKVEIKGSEVVKNWTPVQKDVWKTEIPKSLFGNFNPYADVVWGDWCASTGRHTGAVYLNGKWLLEAGKLEELLQPSNASRAAAAGYLLNLAWFSPEDAQHDPARRVPATSYKAKGGLADAECSEGGSCIGFIHSGNWARYEQVRFGEATQRLIVRVAAGEGGGVIEVHLDSKDGPLLGRCTVLNTGGWQSWKSQAIEIPPTSGVHDVYMRFVAPSMPQRPGALDEHLWFGQVDKDVTTIYAQFPGVDPNTQLTEINVRQSVFYPDKPFRNYITVRGFGLSQAATPWAPPTAEQIGLIGTHWSKGWVIENNTISHSVCSGITLGKYGDEYDNISTRKEKPQWMDPTLGDGGFAYQRTIERAGSNGWSDVGHHVVRNNVISNCEQGGIIGSLGGAFSVISGNEIRDIHVRNLFDGAEIAGIKLHGAIDVQIVANHIYSGTRGIWLDWMAQGARVSGNVLHGNHRGEDLFLEVNHGPILVDNNVMLSPNSALILSQGCAFAHNLIGGRIIVHSDARSTPFFQPHSTAVLGLWDHARGDQRFTNNLVLGDADLSQWDNAIPPVMMEGNVFSKAARASRYETNPIVLTTPVSTPSLVEQGGHLYLETGLDRSACAQARKLVTTERLGKARIPKQAFEQPDGAPIRLDTDMTGNSRDTVNPFPGPVEMGEADTTRLRIR